jgi:preprotein translocase subunit SecF
MNKKRWHRIWTQLRLVKPWYFLVLVVLFGSISVYALRQNNLTMERLRSDVFTADKNNGDVNAALQNLQTYVTSHMNTDLSSGPNGAYPPIQLQYTYERLQQAADQAATAQNSSLYTDAENYCQGQIPTGFSGRYRVACVEQYVENQGVKVPQVPASLYEFDFISPSWSPDLAGWTLVASVVAFLSYLATWLTDRWFKRHID